MPQQKTSRTRNRKPNMALIRCKDCGHMVSSAAEACPKCGRPFTKTKKANAFNPRHDPVHMAGCVIVVIVALYLVGQIIVAITK